MPIALSQPSGLSLRRVVKSWLTPANPSQKKLRARQSGPQRLRSQCYRLRLQKSGSGIRSPRGLCPPELPAGKRGGLHHDSVYPSLASPPCPTGVELRESVPNKLCGRCPADMSPCVELPRRRHRSSTRRVRWGGCSHVPVPSSSTAALAE